MGKPSAYQIELIQKITRATVKLNALKRTHPASCPVEDPHMAGRCTCGADEQNSKINEVLSDLELK